MAIEMSPNEEVRAYKEMNEPPLEESLFEATEEERECDTCGQRYIVAISSLICHPKYRLCPNCRQEG